MSGPALAGAAIPQGLLWDPWGSHDPLPSLAPVHRRGWEAGKQCRCWDGRELGSAGDIEVTESRSPEEDEAQVLHKQAGTVQHKPKNGEAKKSEFEGKKNKAWCSKRNKTHSPIPHPVKISLCGSVQHCSLLDASAAAGIPWSLPAIKPWNSVQVECVQVEYVQAEGAQLVVVFNGPSTHLAVPC